MPIWSMFVIGLAALVGTRPQSDDETPRYSGTTTKNELIAAAEALLAALRAGDLVRAHALAAENFRAQFSPENFGAMLAREHPAVVCSARVVFGLPMDDGTRAVLPVSVFTADGVAVEYRWLLVREGRAWRIAALAAA